MALFAVQVPEELKWFTRPFESQRADMAAELKTDDRSITQRRLGALSPEKLALLERLSRDENPNLSDVPIRPRPTAEALPLSYAQERLWFLDQLNPGNPIYNEVVSVRIPWSIDAVVLERSINEVVRRHEALRTTFTMIDGNPSQVVATSLTLPLPIVDLRAGADRVAEAQRLGAEEVRRPFDLARGPLLQTRLLRLGDHDYVFMMTVHHIITDSWSMAILLRELAALYTAFAAGMPSPLSELAIQYGDFAVWQRQRLQGDVLENHLAYWKRQLADLHVLQLPTDRVRPASPSFRGGRQRLKLPNNLFERLLELSQQEKVTLFMMFLAAFKTLLFRYTGQHDIAVGAPIANRNRPEIQGLIGFFVNTLVLRSDLSGDPSFRELLGRVREVTLESYAHQDLPFERLVEELHPVRDLSRNPLFQVIFQLVATSRVVEPVFVGSLFQVESQTAKFDLQFDLYQTPEELSGAIEYSTDLFEAGTIARMAGHFQRLLEGIAANPECRVSQLPLLTEGEQRQLLAWNNTQTAYPRERSVVELFEQQAAERPEAIAVIFGPERVTYGELNRQANQLAHWLRRRGVGPEVVVGVCLERSLEWVVAVLAIVKAGGVYLPLDPSYPKERLAWMLEDAGARILLTDGPWSEMLSGPGRQAISVRAERESIAQEGLANPHAQTQAENLIYLMYTSGSTGRPKGVGVPHRAVVRLVKESDYLQVEAGDRVGQASNVSFDAATFEVWGALLNGAGLVGIRQEVLLSPTDLAKQLRQDGISVLFVTTDLMHQLISQQPDVFGSLRALLFGGSQVDARWVRELLQQGPPGRLLHVYGPTESTTFASWQRLETVEAKASTLAIGRPIANTRIHLLDGDFNLVPVGVPAEMYVGGEGLARGYWNQAELTAERFLPDPFGGEAGLRLYRTGDLGRHRADGSIEFLGRLDQQVKIRGFRVELGEIEAVLRQHGSVREAVVLAREDTAGDKRLVAYVVASREAGQATATSLKGEKEADVPEEAEQVGWTRELKSYLKEQLPDYMVPSAVVVLETLPLNANGKVNLQVLPSPSPRRMDLESDFLSPRNRIEQEVADIWAEVLALGQLGVTDNFFDLGGHSLLATRVVSRLRQSFHIELPLRVLFERPTVAGVAQWIQEWQDQSAAHSDQGVEPISRASSQEPLADVNQLSDEEVDAMLKNLLRKGQTT